MKVLYERLEYEQESLDETPSVKVVEDKLNSDYTDGELEEYRKSVETSLAEVITQHDKHILTISSSALAVTIGLAGTLNGHINLAHLLIWSWVLWLGCIGLLLFTYITSQISHRHILKHLEANTFQWSNADNGWNLFTSIVSYIAFAMFLAACTCFVIVASYNIQE